MPDHLINRTINAFNTATASENKIHDDATAARFGFSGGLVPGVDVFAYMAHGPVKLWGEDWLTNGLMQARFLKPVYDQDDATLTVEQTSDDALALTLSSRGEICGVGTANRNPQASSFDIIDRGVRPDQTKRPAASRDALPIGALLGFDLEPYATELGREHLDMVREDPALFDDGRIANPAWLLRRANYILAENVLLGPWIHTESDIRLHRLVVDGDLIDVRARVADNFERKGHLIVALDVAILVDGELAVSGRHTAIYQPRQVREG